MSQARPDDKSLACLEADMAYFDARLSLTGTPRTLYQLAQVKTYHALQQALLPVVERRRRDARDRSSRSRRA